MRTPTSLVRSDPRIMEVCETSFPDSPEFAKYLAERVVSLNGSLELARILCSTLLAQCSSPVPTVSAECVDRLAVDSIPAAVGRINATHPDGPFVVVGKAMTFLMRVSGTVVVSSTNKSVDDLVVVPRVSIDQDNKVAYTRLFYCAQAMLAGLKVDPRKKVA